MRLLVLAAIAFAIGGCARLYDGRDGMDGRGVGAGLRYVHEQAAGPRRDPARRQ